MIFTSQTSNNFSLCFINTRTHMVSGLISKRLWFNESRVRVSQRVRSAWHWDKTRAGWWRRLNRDITSLQIARAFGCKWNMQWVLGQSWQWWRMQDFRLIGRVQSVARMNNDTIIHFPLFLPSWPHFQEIGGTHALTQVYYDWVLCSRSFVAFVFAFQS